MDDERDAAAFASLAELDDAIAQGRISFDRYWALRTLIDDREARVREERAYEPVDPHTPVAGAAHPTLITPPPARRRAPEVSRLPPPLVPPPPPARPYPVTAVRLPITGPSADAASTRADDRGRRRRRRPR